MGKVSKLLKIIPKRLKTPAGAVIRMSKTFEMLYEYEAKKKGTEFNRIGNSMKDCEDRLDIIFNMIDGAVSRYDGDTDAAYESKKLLLLASTPEPGVQKEILAKYGGNNASFSDVMTIDEAGEIGVMSWWNQ